MMNCVILSLEKIQFKNICIDEALEFQFQNIELFS